MSTCTGFIILQQRPLWAGTIVQFLSISFLPLCGGNFLNHNSANSRQIIQHATCEQPVCVSWS